MLPGRQGHGALATPAGGQDQNGSPAAGGQDHGGAPAAAGHDQNGALAAGGQDLRDAPPTPVWPCTSCGGAVALDLDACSVCGATFLDGLHAGDQPKHRAVVRFSAMSRGARLAAGAAFGIVIALLLYLLMTVL